MNIKNVKGAIAEFGVKLGEQSIKNCCCLAMYEPKVPAVLMAKQECKKE